MGFNTIVDGDAKLTNNSFGIPNTETAEVMMQAVDNLSVEEISQTLSDCGYYAYFEDELEYHHDGYWDTLSGEWVGSRRKDAHGHHGRRLHRGRTGRRTADMQEERLIVAHPQV